jgi:hypothetical protein
MRCHILLVLRSHAHARDCIPPIANLLFQGQSAFPKVGNSTPTIALDTYDDYSRHLPSSSLLAYCPNAPMAYFRSSCSTALLHIASPHSYPLPSLPSSSSLAYCSNAPMALFRSCCRTALLHIASLHHTRCRVCLHPPCWPIAGTHRSIFSFVLQNRTITHHCPTLVGAAVFSWFYAAMPTLLTASHLSPTCSLPRSVGIP